MRFETPPGRQLQIDVGTAAVEIGGEAERVRLFVATLGYSRRNFVAAFKHERQSAWLDGLEGAFRHFGGVPREVLLDNPKALVVRHDPQTREVAFNERFHTFARYWGFRPRACAPYRARTKGKDENGVGYVKLNAIAGRRFASWDEFEAHLAAWSREGPTSAATAPPASARSTASRARRRPRSMPLAGQPPFRQVRELVRRVQADACVEVDTNAYTVPWRLIGSNGPQPRSTGHRAGHRRHGPDLPRRRRGRPPSRAARPARARHRARASGRHRRPTSRPPAGGADRSGAVPRRAAAAARRVRAGRGRRLLSAAPEALAALLARLKLGAMHDRLDSLLDEAARRELSLREALHLLCAAEMARREERRIQMAMGIAKFPFVRNLDGFEFDAQPSLDPRQARDLAACRWVAHGDALLVLGPPGVGKTHLAVALGREAIRQGYSVLFCLRPG